MISLMEQEARESADVVAKQLSLNPKIFSELIARIEHVKPKMAVTIARGSSDHAATFAKYLLETRAHLITASAAPSVFTLYHNELPWRDVLVVGISQSGGSPDVIEMMSSAKKAGAITVAFVNQVDSPLAQVAEYVIPLLAGEEKAVAATKSYLATLSALINFVAVLTRDKELQHAVTQLPAALTLAAQQDWSAAIEVYQRAQNTLIIGRGYGFPIAQEAALKFKETAKIHAEAFSSAELRHGPFALIEKNFPVMLFAQHDESYPGMLEMANRLQQAGAALVTVVCQQQQADFSNVSSVLLPMPAGVHPICDPLLMIQAFYPMAAQLSLARGLDPDSPIHLTKVTKTW